MSLQTKESMNSAGTILISPHPDDIAYSVGGTMLTELLPRPFLVVSPFTQSIFAPYHTGAHQMAAVTSIREKEDIAFTENVGSRLIWWDFPDSGLEVDKGDGKFPLLFLSALFFEWPSPRSALALSTVRVTAKLPLNLKHPLIFEGARFDRRYADVEAGISKLLDEHRDCVLVSPLGLGYHPDHVIVSRACRKLRHHAAKVYFYEDLPYASKYSTEQIAQYAHRLDSRLRPVRVDIGRVVESKIRNLSFYGSQVGSHETARTRDHARRLGNGTAFEELWTY